MTIQELNQLLEPRFQTAHIVRRPGHGIQRLSAEYEVWVTTYFDAQHMKRNDWVTDSKVGMGLTEQEAIDKTVDYLKVNNEK